MQGGGSNIVAKSPSIAIGATATHLLLCLMFLPSELHDNGGPVSSPSPSPHPNKKKSKKESHATTGDPQHSHVALRPAPGSSALDFLRRNTKEVVLVFVVVTLLAVSQWVVFAVCGVALAALMAALVCSMPAGQK